MTWTVCSVCGTPSPTNRCPDHRPKDRRGRRGRDAAWDRLSKRVRAMTQVCSDHHLGGCHGPIECDHRPEAWRRKERGLPIRLQDVDAVCARHNRLRGSARPDTTTRTD